MISFIIQILQYSACFVLLFIHITETLGGEEWPVAMPPQISDQSQVCILCHRNYTPGIVEDWLKSRHSKTTPELALKKPPLERRISSEVIPETLQATVVGCYECHSLNASAHKDNFEHFGFMINVIVSPNDCRTCHSVEVDQYSVSKKAHAVGNLQQNPLYHTFGETITGVKEIKDDKLFSLGSSEHTKSETCYACHGTVVTVKGMKKIFSKMGEIDVPDLANWPNQGVGRINPDGSLGACTACHPRHNFSIEVARKPYTCSQCHI